MFNIYFIEVLIYNAVLVSTILQSGSVIYINSFIFFSIMIYHRILTTVPSVTQKDPVVYLLYAQ